MTTDHALQASLILHQVAPGVGYIILVAPQFQKFAHASGPPRLGRPDAWASPSVQNIIRKERLNNSANNPSLLYYFHGYVTTTTPFQSDGDTRLYNNIVNLRHLTRFLITESTNPHAPATYQKGTVYFLLSGQPRTAQPVSECDTPRDRNSQALPVR